MTDHPKAARSPALVCVALLPLAAAGCLSRTDQAKSTVVDQPPMRAAGPNWPEVDKTVQRVREREAKKAVGLAVTKSVEHGFFTMTDDEYETALAKAREEIRKTSPKISKDELEAEAVKRADRARSQHEHTYSTRSSVGVEWKTP